MKFKRIIFIAFTLFVLVSCVSCKEEISFEDKAKVVYMLEGGVFRNTQAPITQYYDVKKAGSCRIFDPNKINKELPTRAGYTFVGWFKTKIEEDDVVTYIDEWNFENDLITKDGVTLYAKWRKNYVYTYNVCYNDENGNEISLGKYTVSEGEKFYDSSKFTVRAGYTVLGLYDEEGNPWDENYGHPGGEGDLEIKIFVKYIEGNYVLVRNVKELIANKDKNIYLMNDIDCQGEKIKFGDYHGIFEGNNYTLYNINVEYDKGKGSTIPDFEDESQDSLYISLFGNIEDTIIRNVNFENVHFDINTTYANIDRIYLAGLVSSMKNSQIINVNFSGDYVITNLPRNFNQAEDLIVVTDKAYYIILDKNSKATNVKAVLTEISSDN